MSGEDGDGVDFSVITRAIKCGGSAVEQLLNGVHYGTPEVRCLLLDECDLIIECKVCRNMFRALPNFIAHKRVYCLEAFEDPNQVALPLTQDIHNVDTVVVEPVAPETINNQKTLRCQPTNTLANTIQQLENGTFEGKSDGYKFYTDVADKVNRRAQRKQTHFIKHDRIPGNPNAVHVSLVESAQDVFTEEVMSEDIAKISEEVVSEVANPSKTPVNKASEKPEGVMRSARLRAKSEKLEEKVKTPAKKETISKVINSVEDGRNLREKAKKMFLHPVRKTVTDAKDCDLKALKCLICRKKYANLKCLHYHMKSLHSSKRQVFPCPLCSTVLKHRWGLTRHLMRTHKLSKDKVDKMKEDLKKLTTEEVIKTPESSEKKKMLSAKKDEIQDNKNNSSIKNSSVANISSQGRSRSNSALEKKARFLVDSAKADSMPKSGKKKDEHSTDLVTGPNDRPKKEFSVKFCSRTNSKSAQFFSGLSLLHCKTCSKAFAKKESLLAHSRCCSSAANNLSNSDHLPRRQTANRRQRLGPTKVEQDDTVQESEETQLGQGVQSNKTVNDSDTTANGTHQEAETDIFITNFGQISPAKVVLEHCDATKRCRSDIEAESPRRRSLQQQRSLENDVVKRHLRHSDDTLKEDQKSTDVNNKVNSTCERESKTTDPAETLSPRKDKLTPSSKKAEEEPQIFPTSLRTRQKQRATNHQVSDSEVAGIDEGCKNSTTELVPKNRTMPKRQATKSKKRTLSEDSTELSVNTIEDVETSEVHQMNSSVGTSADLDSSETGQDPEVSFISDDELMDMQKRLEAQLGKQITEVSQELMAKGSPSGPGLETIRSVEEIWISKSPGKPAEKLKSNRMYVLDSSNNKRGRPYCQDSRRVDLLIDEKNLKCLECGELFGSVSNMRRHAIRHLGWQRYRCKLCSSYCSYHKSEMKSHLVRVHASTVNPLGDSFLKYCVIDLAKEGSRLRAQKKQRTMSNRQGARASTAVATTSSVSLKETLQSNEDSTDNHQRDRKKPAVNLNNIVDPDPKRFNISTRNSPRVFDTRPVKRADNMQTLITRKRSYPKQGKQLNASSDSNPDQLEAEPPTTCPVSSEEPRSPTPTVVSKSKTRSIDFCKTRNIDNPWVDGFYKRLSGGSLGALRKQQMTIRPFMNRKREIIKTESSSSSSISSNNVDTKDLPGRSVHKNSLRPTKSDSSLQSLTSSASANLTVTSQNE